MADKISTIILKVDLDCRRCYKKISKTICKLQERENIQTIIFDEKTNTVTISGPFDPKKMCKKLCSKACNVIKDIQIKEKEKEKEKEKPKETKPAGPAEPKKDKPKETKPDEKKEGKPEPKKEVPKEKPLETKQADKSAEAKKNQVDPPASITATEPVWQPDWAGPGFVCGCRPLYEGYYGDNRGCLCGGGGGYGGGWVPEGPPPPAVYGVPVHGGGYNKPSTFFCEEDPQASCSVM